MKHIMVTGCNGMIGTQVVKALLDKGYKVTGISSSNSSNIDHKNYQHITLNLTYFQELRELFQLNEFTHIIHLAAIAHSIKGVKISWSNYYRINTLLSKHLFELATEKSLPIFFSSTVDVYGIHSNIINENTSVNPIGYYAKSKILAEEALLKNVNQPYLIARFAPVYSGKNRKDIHRRYYVKYPKIAYLLNGGMDYEFLSIEKAVLVITYWVENSNKLSGILNVVDQDKHNTKLLLENDKMKGIKPFVIRLPRLFSTLLKKVVDLVFHRKDFLKFSAYKILKPMEFDKSKILTIDFNAEKE